MLSIAVGGKGINGNHSGGDGNYSGGGGGGSFVTLNSGPTFDSLVIGGGGGGGNYSQDYGVGQDANLGTSGDSGGRCFQDADYSVGGVNGNGGEGANCRKNKSPLRNAAGGGGFFTNGGNGGGGGVGGGQSFLNGLAGGTNYYPNGRGGFGGGGSGGGSFFSTNVALQPSELTPVGGTGHRGNGYVTLELISDTVPVTEPTTLVILGLGLAGLRLSRRKKT
ncbi:PEP-CTERM sorting domain-containing protein [Colwellia sp. BRX10-4]|uniref:PEP-CTERM sorting domain-containing protein n=1 Tax=Colwellia sp. BRX10-4 TaxID=2759843 RepID=UPI0015F48853|nr:PEP-CTERM sorting domain-containing protein [Colwellia sp. BRX10-4]MBA6399073.1 PEP-CTERM sorting domain-containing protein [Colwellia sp. BRX10-4]